MTWRDRLFARVIDEPARELAPEGSQIALTIGAIRRERVPERGAERLVRDARPFELALARVAGRRRRRAGEHPMQERGRRPGIVGDARDPVRGALRRRERLVDANA